MIEIAGQRRDDPILAKQHPQRLDIHSRFALQRQQVADFVIAIGDVHRAVLIPNLAVADLEFRRIGMQDLQPVTPQVVFGQRGLLVEAGAGVFRLDEADMMPVAADRFEMVHQLLE